MCTLSLTAMPSGPIWKCSLQKALTLQAKANEASANLIKEDSLKLETCDKVAIAINTKLRLKNQKLDKDAQGQALLNESQMNVMSSTVQLKFKQSGQQAANNPKL